MQVLEKDNGKFIHQHILAPTSRNFVKLLKKREEATDLVSADN
jgi:hypothetical protein